MFNVLYPSYTSWSAVEHSVMLIILIMLGPIWELNCVQLLWAFYLLDSVFPPSSGGWKVLMKRPVQREL